VRDAGRAGWVLPLVEYYYLIFDVNKWEVGKWERV